MKKKASLLATFSLFFLLTSSFSQVIPTAKLVGTVSDNEGTALPGVSVTISSPALILPQMSVLSNAKGYYRFSELPSGIFQAKFELPGFKTVIHEGIIVTAGSTITLDIKMEVTSISEEIIVVGEAPVIDLQSTTTGTKFDKELIQSLPVDRNFEAVVSLAPGMYAGTSHGSDVRSNKFTVDGFVTTRVEHGTSAVNIGYDSIDEIMVDTSGHKAEYGRVKGAVIQVLTKSGGNRLSGEVNLFARNKGLQSDNTKGTPFEGQKTGFDYEFSTGFSLGGPIARDKVWFFVNFNMMRSQSYIAGYPIFGDKNEPINNDFYTPFVKATWQINPHNRIVASGFWRGDYNNDLYASPFSTLEATRTFKDRVYFSSLQWSRVLSEDIFFNLRFGYYRERTDEIANGSGPMRMHFSPVYYVETEGTSVFYRNGRFQSNALGTYFVDDWLGSHEFKIGADIEISKWHDSWPLPKQEPEFKSDPGYGLYYLYLVDGLPYQGAFFKEADRRTQSVTAGGFVQDTWTLAKSVTLNLGLRYDYYAGVYPEQATFAKTEIPVSWHTLAPRISVNYDPFSDGKTFLRAGYGRYYAPLNLVAINYHFSGIFYYFSLLAPDYTEISRFITSDTQMLFDSDTKAQYSDEINIGIQRQFFRNFVMGVTYLQKWERYPLERLDASQVDFEHFKATGEVIWIGSHLVTGTDPETGQPVEFYNQNLDKGPVVYIATNVPGTARKYRGLEFKIEKRASNNWAMLASYVLSKGEGYIGTTYDDTWTTSGFYTDPNFYEFYRWGKLENQREHYLKIQGTYFAPLGFILSANFQYYSGLPFARSLDSLGAGLFLNQGNAWRLVEPRGSRRMPDNYVLDFRIEKSFNLGPGSLNLTADVFNVFNSNEVASYGTRTGIDFMQALAIYPPRYIRLGAIYRF